MLLGESRKKLLRALPDKTPAQMAEDDDAVCGRFPFAETSIWTAPRSVSDATVRSTADRPAAVAGSSDRRADNFPLSVAVPISVPVSVARERPFGLQSPPLH